MLHVAAQCVRDCNTLLRRSCRTRRNAGARACSAAPASSRRCRGSTRSSDLDGGAARYPIITGDYAGDAALGVGARSTAGHAGRQADAGLHQARPVDRRRGARPARSPAGRRDPDPQASAAVDEGRGTRTSGTPASDGDIAAAAPRRDAAARWSRARTSPRSRDLDADGVPCRLYRPAGPEPGVVVHLHGGGFVFHDVEVHDAPARRLANRLGMAVLSVDYRRAARAPVPGGARRRRHGARLAAGTRAAAASTGPVVRARRQRRRQPRAGRRAAATRAVRRGWCCIYPFLDPTGGFDSYAAAADGFDPREAAWYWQQYAAGPTTSPTPTSRRCSPTGSARCRRRWSSPPSTTRCATRASELARRSPRPACAVEPTRYLGQVHGFWRHPELSRRRRGARSRQIAGFLDRRRRRL